MPITTQVRPASQKHRVTEKQNLTSDMIYFLSLRPGRDYPDPDTPGLHVQVSVNGERTLWHHFEYDECRYAECLGKLSMSSLKSTREWVRAESEFVQPI